MARSSHTAIPSSRRSRPWSRRNLPMADPATARRSIASGVRRWRGAIVPNGAGGRTGVLVAEVEGLSKRYGTVQALDGVDVAIQPGCTGLVGSNGAGTSTLIKLLLGLLVPDQGRARVLGHDVAVAPLAVRAQVGYLPEGACLPGDVSAADFVAFMAPLGRPPCP